MVVLLLSIVVGAVFSQIDRAQVRYRIEDQKVDLTQKNASLSINLPAICTRRDILPASMFRRTVGNSPTMLRLGTGHRFQTDIAIEGDMDGEWRGGDGGILYFDGNGWPRSGAESLSLLRRSEVPKGMAAACVQAATAFTQVQNVVLWLHSRFLRRLTQTAEQLTLPATHHGPSEWPKIKTVQITLTTQGLRRIRSP